jgi:hypothetical protein
VHDPNDKQAQMRLSGKKWEEKADAAAAARMEKIKQAPKRKPNDPISVNFRPIDDSQIEMTEKQKKDMYDYFRKQFENDPVIRLTAEQRTDRKGVRRQAVSSLKDLVGEGADVDVVIKVTSKTVYGTMNGKLASAKEMRFEASVKSKWMEGKHQAEDAGTLFDIPKATHRLSEKVKQIIKNDIGPAIPANRHM